MTKLFSPSLPPPPDPVAAAPHRDGGHRATLVLPHRLVHRLTAAALRHDAPVAPVLLAAVGVLLYKYTGREDLTVDVEHAPDRPRPARVSVTPKVPFDALVRTVRGAVEHAGHQLDATAAAGFGDQSAALEAVATADLTLAGTGTAMCLDFDQALFGPADLEQLPRYLLRVLHVVTLWPDRLVRDIDLVTEVERRQLLDDFNDTRTPYPRDTPIHRLFEAQARCTPDRLAVACGERRMTYAEVDAGASRLARRLVAAGITVGQPVGLLVPRTPEMVLATLAVLKAGGAYLPLDPDYPPDRMAYLLADGGVRVLVTAAETAAVRFSGVVVRVDDSDGETYNGAPLPGCTGPDDASRAGDLAYIIYTSGTTGRPKGVQVSHRSVVRLVRGISYVPLSPDTRLLATCAVVFDVATFELWGTLLNGGSLHLVDNDIILNAARLGPTLVEHDINTMWLTSPLFNQLVEQDPSLFRPLRHLLVGGDALSARHVGAVMDACPDVSIVNGYGPTENTTFSTTHLVVRDDLHRIPIGRPIANSTAYVVNRDGQLCPVSVPGELCLGGDGVAAGYRNRIELTNSRFVPNPFAPGELMYRSGDIARWRADGALDFFGRRDHQVKVRGFRIELGEVEKALLDHPDVREAVVLAWPRPGGADKYLCAYHQSGEHVSAGELRAHLRRRLAEHMVPSAFVSVPRMPLNASGKVDRAQLAEPHGRDTLGTEHLAPRGAVEEALLGLAETVLGVRGIGVRHDLRDLGLDSLTATLFASRVELLLGCRLAVSQVVRDSTVERIARRLDGAARRPAPVIPRAPVQPDYPLSPQQGQIYVEQLKDEAATHYNVPVTVDLPPGTQVTRLRDALALLTERHAALRTDFGFDRGAVRQRVRPAVTVPVEVVDGPAPTATEFVRPFDLARAPLWRAGIYSSAAGVRLLLDQHHLITDGLSLGVLLRELLAVYDDPAGSLPDLALQYPDYAAWTASEAAAAARAAKGSYWRQVFASPPASADLPTDTRRPPFRGLDGDIVEVDLGSGRSAALRRLARQHDVTLFAVLAAAYGALLAHLTGQPDVTIGTPASGRTTPGLHRTLGMFVNTVCLRTQAAPELTFGTYLRRMARTGDEAFAHQEFPFEDLVRAVAPRRDYSRNSLFDALIALHSSSYLQVDLGGEPIPVRLGWNGRSVFDLNLQIYELSDTLQVSWQYSSRLFHRATVEAFLAALLALLDTVVADPETPLGLLLPTRGLVPTTLPDLDFDF